MGYSNEFQAGTLTDAGQAEHDLLLIALGKVLADVPPDTIFARIVRYRADIRNRFHQAA